MLSFPLKKALPFLLLFLALALLSLHFRVFAMDEYTYMNAADALERQDPALILEGESGRFYVFPQMVAWLLPFLGDVELAGKLLNLVLYALTVVLSYFFTKNLLGEEAAYWSALFFASNPFVFFLSTRVLTEPLFLALLVLSVGLLERTVRTPSSVNFALFGAASALLVFTRFIGLYVFLIALLYLWNKRKLGLIFSLPAAVGISTFLLLLALFVLVLPSSGNAVERIVNFVAAQVNVRQGDLSLPDQIPSYLLLLPFTLAFAFPWVLPYLRKPHDLLSPSLALLSLAVFGIVLSMELYGMFNFRLFRYLVPAIPFLCILAAHSIVGAKGTRPHLPFLKRFSWNPLAAATVLLNALLGLVLVLGVYTQYEKHVAYAEAGSFVAANCPGSIFSNVPAVAIHYAKRPVSYFTDSAPISETCVLKSSYDAWKFDPYFPEENYRLLYDQRGISIYART